MALKIYVAPHAAPSFWKLTLRPAKVTKTPFPLPAPKERNTTTRRTKLCCSPCGRKLALAVFTLFHLYHLLSVTKYLLSVT